MADEITKIADIIEPEIFNDYVLDRTTEKSEIMNAGVVENDATLNKLVTGGGTILTIPSWNDLDGESQVLDDTNPIESGKITSKAEMATLLIRARKWGASDLAGALAGDDPMKRIGELVSDWWVRDEKRNIMSIIKGVFASTKMAAHVLDKSGSAISASTILDGKQLLGDASDLLTMIYMNSVTFTELQKQSAIQYVTINGAFNDAISIPTYLGYRVICDDSAPVTVTGGTKGVFTLTISTALGSGDSLVVGGKTYAYDSGATAAAAQATAIAALFANDANFTVAANSNKVVFTQKNAGIGTITISDSGVSTGSVALATTTPAAAGTKVFSTFLLAQGAIKRGIGVPTSIVPVETKRDADMSTSYLYNRQAKVLHPKGLSWVGGANIAGPTPSNEELATGTNWDLVADPKKVGLVEIRHLVA